MQFDFFREQPTTVPRDSLRVGDKVVPLQFVVNHRARRYVLRVRHDGTARLTIPRRGSMRAAREFAGQQTEWIAQQLQRLAARPVRDTSWKIGSQILFRGEKATIVVPSGSRTLEFADQTICFAGDVDGDVRPVVERYLRGIASIELPPRVFQFAEQHRVSVRRVTVRDQKSRWGSCSPRGTVSLNWRLVQTPPFVSDYIVLHELMHVRQMNHSARFWREVESVCPEFRAAERWLKVNASLLR